MAGSNDLEANNRMSRGSEAVDDGFSEKPLNQGTGSGIHASVYIITWIFFSNTTILFNKWLIDTAGFRYPIILTTWHLVFATMATQLLARTTSLLDSRHSLPITRRLYIRTILPIGVLYSASLVFSNIVYLYLSVAFIQMLKSTGPVCTLVASWMWGVAQPDSKTFGNIMLIVAGVAISSFGEIEFSWWGFLFQMCGTIAEAVRIVMIQVMLSAEGLRMDPLVGLYYFAPVCTLMNMFVVLFSEGPRFKWEDAAQAGYGVLLANACLAFFLNVISVFLIGKTSGLVMTLSGILKSILLVAASVVLWGTHISLTQTLGYAVALMGLVLYSIGYEQLLNMWEEAVAWGTGTLNREGEMSPTLRKGIMIGCLGFITVIIADF
ncbi:triose phosphate 3-phosphoglycerate phosphate translocator [Fusarium subglutinans]|uniref:Triose phosphate 3-phosphoglycerate phosphate translocator n=1 Tax=Gibberella subglutinans TaxID=42677 RepID=A0A8H5Q0J7_GIBSU|nr:triose phosphate 3-phosphoglycerate phosphate translocator [Fusarium subglutinans]KAF5606791.1 triose phosphate 3-phosphoglycerate phosphate translocator [Fusarium subglutinans]